MLLGRGTTRPDAMAGLVLGVESVPDGLAAGVLAGVNPIAGLYGYLFGMVGGALFTSTAMMAVQATGAMSIIVADVDLAGRDDPARSLFTLSIFTGAVMIVAGLLADLTGYSASGSNRISRALGLLVHIGEIDVPTTIVGVVTIALIVVLQRTPLESLGLVVAVVVGSALAALFAAFDRLAARAGGFAGVRRAGAGRRGVRLAPQPGWLAAKASQDFVGQGAGNVVSGLFQGMPVGGSMSASSLVAASGARSRTSLLYAAVAMALVVVVFAPAVELVAMPALAGLLVGVGISVLLFVIRQSSRLDIRRILYEDDGRTIEVDPPDVLA